MKFKIPTLAELAGLKPRYPFNPEFIQAVLDELVRLGIASKTPDDRYYRNRDWITDTEEDQLDAFEAAWYSKRGIAPLASN